MKTALITGASSGIGKETAFVYAKNNYNIVLVARRLEKLNKIKAKIQTTYNVKVTVINMDLSVLNAAENLYKKVSDLDIKIDVLINNAGFGLHGNFIDEDSQKQEQMLVLNMITLTKLCQLFAKDMIKHKGGNIVSIASTAAFQPVPSLATYSATKSYVLNFSESISFELKNKNVFVTAICPGATQSEFGVVAGFSENADFFKKTPTAKELANFIFKAMQRKKTSTIHGFKNWFLAFSGRFAPRKLTTYIAYKVMN